MQPLFASLMEDKIVGRKSSKQKGREAVNGVAKQVQGFSDRFKVCIDCDGVRQN